MRLSACNTSMSSPIVYITDRSKSILLLWFYLFYVLESIFVLFEPNVRFHIFVKYG